MRDSPFMVDKALRVVALTALLVLAVPALAWAQAPRLPAFRPDVTFGVVFDDNVLARPEATGDIFMRLTPGFDLRHESTRVSLGAGLRFDAERYQERSDLNTAVARQATGFDLTWRPNRRFAVTSRAGYQRTQTPQDLNVTTGLTGGRQQASRVDAAAGVERTLRPGRRLSLGGEYGYDDLRVGLDSEVRRATVRYTHQLNARSELALSYRFEDRQFRPGPLVRSHLGLITWSHLLTLARRLVLEGGPRVVDGELRPDVTVSLTQTVSSVTSFTVGYSHTQDVAIGIVGLLKLDRLSASVTARRGRRWEASFGGGAFRNVQTSLETLAYDVFGSLGRSLTDAAWLVVSVNRTLNELRAPGTTLPGSTIRRNTALISLRIAPWRPR